MIQSIKDCVTLSNGVQMPYFGLGVWQVTDEAELINAVNYAVDFGYASIDTATAYKNEDMVGKAIAGYKERNLFITTKLWNPHQGYDTTLKAFDRSMEWLGLDVLDLYLIHWPCPAFNTYVDTWKAMVKLYEDKRIRAIGVANFNPEHLKAVADATGVMPMVNQVECHPLLQQRALKEFCDANKIVLEAYSPLLNGNLSDVAPMLTPIAQKHGKTEAQICLRWQLDMGNVVIPKSVHKNRIEENGSIFDFALDAEDMAAIANLDRGERYLPDPAEFNFKPK